MFCLYNEIILYDVFFMRLLGKGYGGVKKFCILMNMLLFLVVKLCIKIKNIIRSEERYWEGRKRERKIKIKVKKELFML